MASIMVLIRMAALLLQKTASEPRKEGFKLLPPTWNATYVQLEHIVRA
jgi:hypothetical protein